MSIGDLFQEMYFFQSFTPAEIKRVEEISKKKHYLANQSIFQEGDEAAKLFLVESGSVKISKNGETEGILTIGQGGMFGEMPFLDGGGRSATATAIEETHLIEIPYTKLSTVLLNHPEMALKFFSAAAKYVSKRLRLTTENLQHAKDTLHRHF